MNELEMFPFCLFSFDIFFHLIVYTFIFILLFNFYLSTFHFTAAVLKIRTNKGLFYFILLYICLYIGIWG